MKLRSVVRTLLVAAISFGLLIGVNAAAQSISLPLPNYAIGSNGGGGVTDVQNFAQWAAISTNSVTSGANSVTVGQCYFPLNGNSQGPQQYFPFAVGVQVKVLDPQGSNSETVTITGVSPVALANGSSFPSGYSCGFTATFSNAHTAGFKMYSGDFGIGEAAAFFQSGTNQGFVVATPNWGGSPSTIQSMNSVLFAGKPIGVEDISQGYPTFYAVRPSTLSLLSGPAQMTLSQSAGGSLTSSGTYLMNAEYIDQASGISLPGTESASITLTSGNQTIATTAVGASAGAGGWVPLITASGGGAGTEIEVPVTSAVCTLSLLTLKPSCAIGAIATISANPSGTAKEVVESTAHTAFALQPFAAAPAPFVTSYGPFAAVASLSGANADLAQLWIPPAYFNQLGKAWDVCAKISTATQVATSVITLKLNIANQLGQSPVTLSTEAFATYTQASAGTITGCWRVTTSATGASGTFTASTPYGPFANILNSAPNTAQTSNDVTTAASSAVNLTLPTYLSVNMAVATAAVTNATVQQLTINPVVSGQ